MIELARFPHAQPARMFAEVLKAQGIASVLREEGGQTVMHLEDPARFDEARLLLDAFVRNPNDPRFSDAAWQASELAPRREGEQGGQPPLFSGRWLAGMGPVTKLVLIVTLLVYVSPMLFGSGIYRALMFPPTLDGLMSQPWRLFTPMLLHFGLLHIAFNLLWWLDLGRTIERYQSSLQLVWVTLVTSGVSSLAQFLASGPAFGGLSGVVYGLLGYLWLYGRVNPRAGYALRREIVIFMLVWLVICYVGLAGIVANEAHLAGLISGCVLGALTGYYRRRRFYDETDK